MLLELFTQIHLPKSILKRHNARYPYNTTADTINDIKKLKKKVKRHLRDLKVNQN